MDTTTSTKTRTDHSHSELEKFRLYFEMVPVPKTTDRSKRSHSLSK